MKKKLLFVILCLFCSLIGANAKECKSIEVDRAVNDFISGTSKVDVTIDNKTYKAGTPYSQIPYCNHNGSGEFMSNGACWSFAVSNILRSYGSDVYAEQFAEYFCNNATFRNDLTGLNNYHNITLNNEVHEKFNMTIENIDDTMEALDEALDQGKSVLASVKASQGNIFTGSSHYIAIIDKEDSKYYVLNSTDDRAKGWISREEIVQNVIQKKGQGIYSVEPKECVSSNSNSSSSSGTLQEDKYPGNGFSQVETKDITCKNIFMKNETELNDLGEAMQGFFNLIKIATPIIVLILTTIDYIKAIINQDDGEIKKATQRGVKRLIFGILIFLLPFLLDLIFHAFGLYDISTCGIGSSENKVSFDDTTFDQEYYYDE